MIVKTVSAKLTPQFDTIQKSAGTSVFRHHGDEPNRQCDLYSVSGLLRIDLMTKLSYVHLLIQKNGEDQIDVVGQGVQRATVNTESGILKAKFDGHKLTIEHIDN